MRYLCLICAAILSVSCAQSEQYIQIKLYDETYKNELAKELDAEGVPYSVEGNVLKYQSKYSAEIKKAMSKVNTSYPALFTVKDKLVADKYEKSLSVEKIPFVIRTDDEGDTVFIIDSVYRAKASELLRNAATGK